MEEIVGTLASGNRFRITPYSVEVVAYPGGSTLTLIDVNNVAEVRREGSLLRLQQRDGQMVELGMQSLDDAGRAEYMLRNRLAPTTYPSASSSTANTASSVALDYSGLPRGMVVAAVCGAGVLIGSFGPWASVATAFGSISVAGTEGDGQLTLIAGLVATGIAVVKLTKPLQLVALTILMLIAFIAAAGVGAYDWVQMESRIADADSEFVRASVGWGLPLLTISAVIGAIVSGRELRESRA